MNLREFIQSEILNALSEDYDLDQAFNDAEPVEEGVMSELDILAQEARDLKSFVKTAFKEFDSLPKNKETLKWLEGIYKDLTNESIVNEGKKYKKGDKLKIKLKNGKEFDLTFHSYGRQKGMAFGKFDGDTKPFSLDTIKEEKLDEKLITFSNRAPYGQIVFMAGGAGSGKGFAIDNFIDSAGFRVRDVDEMKKAVGKLD